MCLNRRELVIRKYAGGQALASALQADEIDMAFHLPIDSLTALRDIDGITIQSFDVGYQYMMHMNMRRSPLSDLNVRQAVDMAIDRQELSQELCDGDPTRSVFA